MPRASEYLLPGYTYHLTQRCQNREFLLKYAKDRDAYREWLREGVKRYGVPIYGFCITRNHVHIMAHADDVESISGLMHLAAGATAKQYNTRTHHTGSMWQHPYQCTAVENGRHLLNCLAYINMNMVRAGVVSCPAEWKWCSHDELVGRRKRYRILNIERLLDSLGIVNGEELRDWYCDAIESRIASRSLQREKEWTESLVAGSSEFVRNTTRLYTNRWKFQTEQARLPYGSMWTVREPQTPYNDKKAPMK